MNVAHRLLFAPLAAASAARRRLTAVIVMTALAGSATLAAHDMWIEPTTFAPTAGDIVGARLRVGQQMLGDPLPRDVALIKEFVAEDAQGRRPLVGRDGTDPAGFFRASEPGVLVVGYFSHPSRVELTAEKFATYLKEEGLDAVAATWAGRPHGAATRESFIRCAKSLVLAGPPDAAHGDRPLGFTLELVAERNPYTMAAGQELPVRLTYQGKALPGALVVVMDRTASTRLTARSDRNGRVRFRLPHAGMWMVKAVHMIQAPPDAQADWQSFWASLTFDLPGSTDVSRTASR